MKVMFFFWNLCAGAITFHKYIQCLPADWLAELGIEIEITDKIKIPVPVGKGQYGNPHFLTEKEKDQIFAIFNFTEGEVPGGNVVEMKKDTKGRELIRYTR